MAADRSCHTEGTYSDSLRGAEKGVRASGPLGGIGREVGGGQLLTMVTHVVSQQAFSGKSLGTVRALKALLWGGAGRKKGSL